MLARMSIGPTPPDAPVPLPPHPVLPAYFKSAAEKRPFLRKVFDETAADYDRVERALSLGSGRWYRRRALARAGFAAGLNVLDVAVGTGLVAREALALVGASGSVVGLDPSIGMIRQARAQLALPIVQGVGETLPFADASFDAISMGYALRHLPDLRATFAEFARVLKPGGRLCVLEITRPAGRAGRAALAAYFRGVLPVLARVVGSSAKTRDLWSYYWETIDACVPPDRVLDAIVAAGFSEARRRVELGIFSDYTARR